jgi:hypothetical protein
VVEYLVSNGTTDQEIGGLDQFLPNGVVIEIPIVGDVVVNVHRQYGVINVTDDQGNVDGDRIYLGATFDTANVDSDTEIITFVAPHNFLAGDQVRYYPGDNQALANFGLQEGKLYFVQRIDDTRIRLVYGDYATQVERDAARARALNPDAYYKAFDALSSVNGGANTLAITGHGFETGDLVIYDAPDPITFATGQVDASVTYVDSQLKLVFQDNNTIVFLDDEGNLYEHGFTDNELVVYRAVDAGGDPAQASALTGLVNGETYRVRTLGDYAIQLVRSERIVLNDVDFFLDNGTQKFLRNDGGSFITDGFTATEDVSLYFDPLDALLGKWDITGVSSSALTVASSPNFQATRIADNSFTFTAQNGSDLATIVWSEGNFANEGFAALQTIDVTRGAVTTQYTIAAVSGNQISLFNGSVLAAGSGSAVIDRGNLSQIAFDQDAIAIGRPQDSVPDIDNPGAFVLRESNDTHTLIREKDLPLSGLQDQNSYYVEKINNDTIRLYHDVARTLVANIEPVSDPDGTRTLNSHRLAEFAVDLDAIEYITDGVQINALADTITFLNGGHSYSSGDTLRYRAGVGIAAASEGDDAGTLYYVRVLDASTIQLVDSLAKATNPTASLDAFTPADINDTTNVITQVGHGLSSGDAVTYIAPAPATVGMAGVSEVSDSITFATAHGFSSGDKVLYTVKDFVNPDPRANDPDHPDFTGLFNDGELTAIGGLVHNSVYRVKVVSPTSIQLKVNDVVTTDFWFVSDNGVQKLVRSDQKNWADNGFAATQVIQITGAPGYNGSYTIGAVSGDTLTLTGGPDVQNQRITDEFQYIRGANPGDKDQIVWIGGSGWAAEGFAVGQQIRVGAAGLNSTGSGEFYTIDAISGNTLTLTASQRLYSVASDLSSVTRGTVNATVDVPAVIQLARQYYDAPANTILDPDTHAFVRLQDVAIGGLTSNATYYVDVIDADHFRLKLSPSAAGTLNLAPRATDPSLPFANHFIGQLAVDLVANQATASVQQLRIDIAASFTYVDGTNPVHSLTGPEGVSLSELVPNAGDGITTAYAKGSGGGFVGSSANEAKVISNPTVSAVVAAAQLTTSGSVVVDSLAETHTTAFAVNGTGGFVAVGSANADSDQYLQSTASIADNASVVARGSVTVEADVVARSASTSRSSAGGVVGTVYRNTDYAESGGNDQDTNDLKFAAVASIGQNAVVRAINGLARVDANASVSITGKSTGSGIGFGGDASADVQIDVASSKSEVVIGQNAILEGNQVLLSATMDKFYARVEADGRGAGFYGEGTAYAALYADIDLTIDLKAGAQVTGWEGVDFITRFDNVDTLTKTFSRSTGLFGYVDSTTRADIRLDSAVLGAGGALVTAGPRPRSGEVSGDPMGHPTGTGIPTGNEEHLAFYVSTDNGSISNEVRASTSKRSLALGGSSKSPNPDTVTDQIDFDSNVLILSGRSPELLVKELSIAEDGKILTAVEVTVNDSAGGGASAEGEGQNVDSDTIVVNDITNPGPGDVVFVSAAIAGAGGTWTFRETLSRVKINNRSDKDIVINRIDVTGGDQALVWFDPQATAVGGTPGAMSFNIVQDVSPTVIEILNLGPDADGDGSDVYLNGTINNPIGTTSIVNTVGSVYGTADADSRVRTNILKIDARDNVGTATPGSESISGYSADRVNVDIVDAAGLPQGANFRTNLVNSTTHQIVLGQSNPFVTGQLVQYVKTSGADITGLTSGGYYYTVVSDDGLSVGLAETLGGEVIEIGAAGSPTDTHTLTVKEQFTVDAGDNVGMDLRALQRMDGANYIVDIDRVSAGNDIDLLLQSSLNQTGGGLYGGILVKWDNEPGGETHYTFFDQNDGAQQSRDRGVYANSSSNIASTYDFRGRNPLSTPVKGAYELAGLQAGNNVKVVAVENANSTANRTVNVLGITELDVTGTQTGTGHITVLTNGWVALTEKTGDLRVESITSNFSDVLLYSPQRIIDATGDSNATSDVAGRNITMVAASSFVNPDASEVSGEVSNPTREAGAGNPLGGIGRSDNFLEINVANSAAGVLRAYDMASAAQTEGIFIDEMSGDLYLHTVKTSDDVALRTKGGSILDAKVLDDVDGDANVLAQSVDLDANGGSIGQVGNDVEIDSRRASTDHGDPLAQPPGSDYLPNLDDWLESDADDVGLEATGGIYLTEVDDELRLVLAHSYSGNIRLTVREDAGAISVDENLYLIDHGQARFAEDDTTASNAGGNQPDAQRNVPHGQIFAEQGSVELRVGDNVFTDENAEILAAQGIVIRGDHIDNDANFGTHMILRGRIVAGAVVSAGSELGNTPVGTATPSLLSPVHLTQIFGNADEDFFQFGDPTGNEGGTSQNSAGYIFIGSKTRVYGSADATVDPEVRDGDNLVTDPGDHGNDGEDTFTVFYLQDAATRTSPETAGVVAEHTLTLDGQAGSDSYFIHTTGSNGVDERNYIINLLDHGHEDDGVDEAFIYGFDSDVNGLDGLGNKPGDDIFLLRAGQYIPGEPDADRPGYVAMLHGQVSTYEDVIVGNESSTEVQRINYDTGLNGRLVVEGRGGNDAFYSDDATATTTLDGGEGFDTFQVGQIFGTNRNQADGNLLPEDVFANLVATTRGWLSAGATAPMVALGGSGNDEFRVYSNQSALRLEGGKFGDQ